MWSGDDDCGQNKIILFDESTFLKIEHHKLNHNLVIWFGISRRFICLVFFVLQVLALLRAGLSLSKPLKLMHS